MTTHCPLFVDRTSIKSNILVHKNKAVPAKDVRQIRDILGVRASDNLQNAELVLLVEGEEDRKASPASGQTDQRNAYSGPNSCHLKRTRAPEIMAGKPCPGVPALLPAIRRR